ncbi:endonuclease [Vandammella animalimorsus]|uniref:Endonuclease n=1 Tax=Vandammella animalimorsus TaxID=2029117 RepID=A0A2A2T4M3_9BURK|nr:YqaJ viral recombinase family protein [Vandammella animalimorsus]PAT31851.1 endonuclease [Vandammella animalimorsus]PAX16502.1 endonuclease [Vandammella animalimorsus]PAX18917.1 endonuclease [Vandammella animalimorsus]
MQQHQLTQGSPEWHAHRAQFFNASDAPAMLGISPYKTRAALLQERATGIAPEITPQQQRIFDRGHQLEALARPIAEDIVGEELFPIVGTEGKLAASFDGITMLGDTVFEHKTLNQSLRYDWDSDNGWHLPEHYQAQMEQQLMVSGAERVLFMASEQGEDGQLHYQHCWYASNPAMRQRIIDGWAQFEADLAAWQPAETAQPAQAAPVESLPAPIVTVGGALSVGGNLPAFGQALRAFIERIPAKPATDQEFADAEAACKALKKAEDALKAAEDQALAQISDVEIMRRTVADLQALARTTRLATEKLVKAEKEARKTALVMQARADFARYVQTLEANLKGMHLQLPAPDFGAAVKGLSSLESMRQKLTAALLEGQAQANTLAERIARNLQMLERVSDHSFLFADREQLVCTYTDRELERIIAARIAEHQQAEAARLEAERERIRKEEEARAAKAAQEQVAEILSHEAQVAAFEKSCRESDGRRAAEIAHIEATQPPTLRLGEINTRLAPLSITEAGLRQLGFEPAGHDRRAVLYHEHQWPDMCAAIVARVQAAAAIGADA